MENRFEVFTVSIANISRLIRKIENQEMKNLNLRSFHVECLYYLYASNIHTAAELCAKCGEDKATISRTLEDLEQKGFLTREKQDKKRYNTEITLTDKGQETGKFIHDKIQKILEDLNNDFSHEQRMILYSCLFKINKRLATIAEKKEEI